jgi:hypothetical protein
LCDKDATRVEADRDSFRRSAEEVGVAPMARKLHCSFGGDTTMHIPSMLTLTLCVAAAGCAPEASSPAGKTTTTSATSSDPSYGNGNMNGWSDPAASGNASHGSGNVGTTTPLVGAARGDGGAQ